jgi:hypothetical protein
VSCVCGRLGGTGKGAADAACGLDAPGCGEAAAVLSGGRGGSLFMMLTAGIESEDGKS